MNSFYYDKRNALLSQVEGSLNRYKNSIWALTRHYDLAISALEKLSEGFDLPEPLGKVVALVQAEESALKECQTLERALKALDEGDEYYGLLKQLGGVQQRCCDLHEQLADLDLDKGVLTALEKLSEGFDLPEPLGKVVALVQAKQSAWKEYGARFQELDDWEN